MAQIVVITGGTAGVGRATARLFAEGGARVGLLARGQDGLHGALEDVRAAGGEAFAVPTEVADPGQVEEAARALEERLGPIDVWVNNTMTSIFAFFIDVDGRRS